MPHVWIGLVVPVVTLGVFGILIPVGTYCCAYFIVRRKGTADERALSFCEWLHHGRNGETLPLEERHWRNFGETLPLAANEARERMIAANEAAMERRNAANEAREQRQADVGVPPTVPSEAAVVPVPSDAAYVAPTLPIPVGLPALSVSEEDAVPMAGRTSRGAIPML